ncbi:MAG: anaerobic ribonucleoside-triphosphate reductase activating protein, partial [Parcubacteria group bacterium]
AEVLEFLKTRKKLLDAVCVSGGEPTLQQDLIAFIRKIKKLGYLVKLDTNGTRPDVIERLLNGSLIDYIAMDVKAPWPKYRQIVTRVADLPLIQKSVTIIKRGRVLYEFRSTVLPALHSREDILTMAKQIEGADKYVLQAFRPATKLVNQKFCTEASYNKKQLADFATEIGNLVRACKVR